MFTIPAWMLSVEAVILYILLISVYFKYRKIYFLVGWIALVLSFPILTYIFAYAIIDSLSMELGRSLIRYIQALLMLTKILLFIVILRIPQHKENK